MKIAISRGRIVPPEFHCTSSAVEADDISVSVSGRATLNAKAPFAWIRAGAFAIEHNQKEPKRRQSVTLLARHGYRRVHTCKQDDYFALVNPR